MSSSALVFFTNVASSSTFLSQQTDWNREFWGFALVVCKRVFLTLLRSLRGCWISLSCFHLMCCLFFLEKAELLSGFCECAAFLHLLSQGSGFRFPLRTVGMLNWGLTQEQAQHHHRGSERDLATFESAGDTSSSIWMVLEKSWKNTTSNTNSDKTQPVWLISDFIVDVQSWGWRWGWWWTLALALALCVEDNWTLLIWNQRASSPSKTGSEWGSGSHTHTHPGWVDQAGRLRWGFLVGSNILQTCWTSSVGLDLKSSSAVCLT